MSRIKIKGAQQLADEIFSNSYFLRSTELPG